MFKSNFDSLLGVYQDDISNIPIITGNSYKFYPDFDNEDPIPAYLRGLYFNGKGSVIRLPVYGKYKSPKLILSINWTIEIWLNPSNDSGCFLSYARSTKLLSICHEKNSISIDLSLINSSLSNYFFSINDSLNSWNMISVYFEYSNQAYLSVYLNSQKISYLIVEGAFIENFYSDSHWEIGKSFESFYSGFIYQLSIYAGKNIQSYALSGIENCLNPSRDFCIPDCGVGEYWIGPYFNNCGLCLPDCEGGCRRNNSCSLCDDLICERCQDFKSGTCSKCLPGTHNLSKCKCDKKKVFDYNSNTCTKCKSNQFYNEISCVNCSNSCKSCINSTHCLTCKKDSHLENNICVCNLGFSFTTYCEAKLFKVTTSQLSNSKIKLSFSENLLSNLKLGNINIRSQDCSIKKFSIEKLNDSEYILILSFNDVVKKGSKIEINLKNIYSVNRSGLNKTFFEFTLEGDQYEFYLKEAENSSKILTVSITIASISISMFNPSSASLWSFISCIQILSFIALSTIDLPPKFYGFLRGLQSYIIFPNIFDYFISDREGKYPYKQAYEFGYKNHLFLKNVGELINSFICLHVLWILTYLVFNLQNGNLYFSRKLRKSLKAL